MRGRLTAVLLALSLSFLAACGGDDDADADGTATSPASVASPAATAIETAAPTSTATPAPAAIAPETATATATPAPTATAEELAAWASQICVTTLRFDAASEAIADGVIGSSLAVDDRVAREIRNNAVLIEATSGMVEQLEALAPPAGTDRFQQALTDFLSSFALLLEATQNNLSLATSHDSVDESYRDFVSTMGPLAQDLRFEASGLPPGAQQAIVAVESCGTLAAS